MIVMREVFKRDKPLDNGSGAVSLCVFHSSIYRDWETVWNIVTGKQRRLS